MEKQLALDMVSEFSEELQREHFLNFISLNNVGLAITKDGKLIFATREFRHIFGLTNEPPAESRKLVAQTTRMKNHANWILRNKPSFPYRFEGFNLKDGKTFEAMGFGLNHSKHNIRIVGVRILAVDSKMDVKLESV